jgi:hypothetical protein
MTRQALDYRKLRDQLHARLGGHCAECGTRAFLSVDHQDKDGCDWEPRKVSSHMRVRRYMKELRAGVRLRLLCRAHNGRDGRARLQGKRKYESQY